MMGQPLRPSLLWLCGLATVCALAVSCLSNDNRHDAIPCESCHGNGAFTSLNPACESCHEAERPLEHYPGSCGDSGCHIPVSWSATGGVGIGDDDDTVGDDDDVTVGDDDDTTPGDDDDTTPGDDDDTTTPTGNDHEFLPLTGPHDQGCPSCHTAFPDVTGLRLVCLDCHEADRDGPGHYAGQDCAHCHTITAAWGNNSNHPFVLGHPKPVPDPVADACEPNAAPSPVETCDSCHPVPTDRPGSYTCTSCHAKTPTDCRHSNGNFPGYVYADANCLGCHSDGQN
jgi:hypothetical protein